MAIPTKITQPSMGKVEICPPAYLQTNPNTGSTTSQKTRKLALRIGYHSLDKLPLPRKNLTSLLNQPTPIPPPTAQERKGQVQTLHPCQQKPSKIPPWIHHKNQSRKDLITGSLKNGNFTHTPHTQSRHHVPSLEPPDKYKWRKSASHRPGYQ